jgi:hydrogenase maturation protein HypF
MSFMRRIRVEIEGIVQGVGFRPFVYKLAAGLHLRGWVRNTPRGVLIEAEGTREELLQFVRDLREKAPPLAAITAMSRKEIPQAGGEGFAILPSSDGESCVEISPDCDVCPACLDELFDPADRRYRYPFINCTNCGPRYSIITGIPYDRHLTTMARFEMCSACRSEYEDPGDRRFHAQPNACPCCGPRLRLVDGTGRDISGDPLDEAIDFLRGGGILAVKGTGGYHLAVDACNDAAVEALRLRKRRDEKPFALMSPGMAEIGRYARYDETAQRFLSGPERPVVLLGKREGNPVSPLVAPANGYFGVMLPSTPLQYLLLRGNFMALVMTSGNLSDEPIAYRDSEARHRLADVVDLFLTHDRDIHTPSDDSVIRMSGGKPLFLRRSRGYVPRGIMLPAGQRSVLAMGGELKSAICLTRGDRAFMGQHVGDLKNSATHRTFEEIADHLRHTFLIEPALIAHDLHPDYLSNSYAERFNEVPRVTVQHHHAHMASCMAENRVDGEVMGVIFDGAGFGLDGTVWGGEFLTGGYRSFKRSGHLRYVPLPGGDAAAHEPFRMAISYLYDLCGEKLFDAPVPSLRRLGVHEKHIFLAMLRRGINSPLTSSCGRLFDAVAALIGLRERNSYEGQAAIELEAAAELGAPDGSYPYALFDEAGGFIVDFRLMIAAILKDIEAGETVPLMARRFHETLAAAVADGCARMRRDSGMQRVVLSGGVFQNVMLTERVESLLVADGFRVFTHRLVPPNDGGLALGQAVIAGHATAPFPQSQR